MSLAAFDFSLRRHTRIVCVAILLASALSLYSVRRDVDRQLGTFGHVADVLFVPSGSVLRRLCLGHEGLAAAIYWTRVVQYFGRQKLAHSVRFDLLGQLLRITTDLDPHLIIAYRFGSVFLAEKPPGGAGQPEVALQLLRRGIVANPDYWRLWQDLGFIYYWDMKDYAMAARVFRAGSERPGAAIWMKALAASVAAEGGETRTSQLLWSEIYRNAENDSIRRSAMEHLGALAAQEDMRQLNVLLARYWQKTGRGASSFQELLAAGWLSGLPRDPSGVPYQIAPDGRATLSPRTRIDLRLLQ